MTDQHERLSTDSAPTDRDLDRLLERWHTDNVHRAAARRDELLAALRASGARNTPTPVREPQMTFLEHCRIFAMHRYTRAAACLIVLVALITLLVPTRASVASDWLLVPDGGRLDARDANGGLIGPCPLNHTDVTVEVSGPFSRVTVNQRYTNDYDETIEAVYVFPLSHEGAVDRMTMTVGDRVVVGEVKERAEARQIYESARAAGYVASLLEQERPNIFTQSVANIEPGETIDIEISYVELIETVDGVSSFTFPMVVAPRYIPGSTKTTRSLVPAELDDRRGVVLLGPAQIQLTDVPEEQQTTRFSPLPAGRLHTMLKTASPIAYPGTPWWGEGENASMPAVWSTFTANYANGSKEIGWLYDDGTGQVNGRWFFLDADLTTDHGTGYESNTDQVPDASRITPMPVPPGTRAGHDVSVTVHLDTGGPALEWIESELHTVSGNTVKGDSTATVVLAKETEIPNRDFILRWKQNDEAVNDAHFAHFDADKAGFFTLMLQPPGRPTNADARAREIVFVLDCSGSMEGFPIEKAKQTMLAALKTLRPKDVFNVVTFNNSHEALYAAPQPGTEANVAHAMQYVDSRQGGGGTEMKPAVIRALTGARGEQARNMELTLRDLVDLPADGRAVEVVCPTSSIRRFTVGAEAIVSDDLSIKLAIDGLPAIPSDHVRLEGTWTLQEGHRTLVVSTFTAAPEPDVAPLRLVLFLSDGEVGNDDAVIQAVRENASDARVFTIAIGDSPNRSLLDAMAQAGRGKADYVTLSGSPDETVARFARRIQTPVLTDIEIALDGIEIHDTIPALDAVPDLYDEQPLVIHGRYTDAAKGTLTVRGNTGGGAFERAIAVDLPEAGDEHDVIKTLWAREHVDELKKAGDVGSIIAIGTDFQIMTEHTSFVAVERSRILVAGEPRLVPVPIEMPHGQSWSGIFGRPEPQQPHVEYLGEALREAYKNVRGVDAVEAESAFGTYGVDLERFGQIVNEDKLYYRYEPMLTIGGRTATTTADFYFATPRTQSIDGYFEPAAGWAEGNVSLHLMPDATTTTALSLDSNVQLREPLQARIAQIQDLQAPRLEAQAAGLLALDEMDATRLGRMSEAQTRGFAGGGGGGGFGGGTGRGGGGSLFDSPDQVDSMTLGDMTIDQRRQAGADVVVRFVQPDAWEQNGGEVAKLGFEPTAGLAVTPLQSSAEAEALSRNVEVFGDVVRGWYFDEAVTGPAVVGPLLDPTNKPVWYTLGEPLTIHTGVKAPLPDVLAAWSEATGIDATIDTEALTDRLHMDLGVPVPLAESQTTAGDALSALLHNAATAVDPLEAGAIGYEIRDGAIVVTTTEDVDRPTAILDVSDIISAMRADDALEQLRDLVVEFVDPHTWEDMGGDLGLIETVDTHLLIQHTAAHHLELERFLDQIRMALGLAPTGRAAAATPRSSTASGGTVVYAVPGADQRTRSVIANRLYETIVSTIEPDSWLVNGGDRMIATTASLLIVDHVDAVHERIEPLLDATTPGECTFDVHDLLDVTIETADQADQRARAALAGILTGLIEPTSWQRHGGIDSVLNDATPAFAAICPPEVCREIDILLDQLRLARGLAPTGDHELLAHARQAEAAGDDEPIRVYALGDLQAFGADDPAQAVITNAVVNGLRLTIAPETWVAHGGEDGWAIVFGDVLVVRATPERHASTTAFLDHVLNVLGDPDALEAERRRLADLRAEQIALGTVLAKPLWPYVAETATAMGVEVSTDVPDAWKVDADDVIRVSLLIDPDRSGELKRYGVTIEGMSTRGHAIATVPLERLAEIARQHYVKRVESMR